ncbi:unnamed protein product [Lactuca saligna]|uniref:Uncharacterized protein n=1 Tax=Lactuca saligna TaxID=75948 RepID=A0AA35ZJC9_LACSI|nr:unnamed protein product [Lactuca saligna]
MFVISDSRNFHFVGSIPEVILERVSIYSEIIQIYRKIPKLGERVIAPTLQVVLDAGDAPKRKAKSTVVTEELDEDTISDVLFNDDIQTSDTTANESDIPKQTQQQVIQTETSKNPILNLSQPPVVPNKAFTSNLIANTSFPTTTIHVHIIFTIPETTFTDFTIQIPISQRKLEPIFIESTRTTSISQPQATSTSEILIYEPIVFEADPGVDEYITSEPISTSVAPVSTSVPDLEPINSSPLVHDTSLFELDVDFMVANEPNISEPYVAIRVTTFNDDESKLMTRQDNHFLI